MSFIFLVSGDITFYRAYALFFLVPFLRSAVGGRLRCTLTSAPLSPTFPSLLGIQLFMLTPRCRLCEILTGVFIPLWIIPDGFSALAAGAFCIQFGVQGAWGVVSVFDLVHSP